MSGQSHHHPAIDFIFDCLAGGTAGAISKTVAAPLERVKLLLQTQDANERLRNNKYTGKATSQAYRIRKLYDQSLQRRRTHRALER